jgi:ElaB/YqjD/DUF883 family membrane-anchored ribosome-binding protein
MNWSAAMQTTSDGNKGSAASPNSTDQRTGQGHAGGAGGPATELGRHYGEHGHPATTSAGPPAQDSGHSAGTGEQASSAMAKAGETAQDLVHRASEQVSSAGAAASETAQDLANSVREQAGPAAQAVYDQGARAGHYVTRNVHQYPATALLIAAAVGYGLAYLLHGGSSGGEVHSHGGQRRGDQRRGDQRLYRRTN